MKTAVSVPDQLFERADELARQQGKSRSALYSAALAEYVDRHGPDAIRERLNAVWADAGSAGDEFVAEAARRSLEGVEW
jgi:predicted transcriptional regulator